MKCRVVIAVAGAVTQIAREFQPRTTADVAIHLSLFIQRRRSQSGSVAGVRS
jgi:hypothetical protein